MEKQARDARLAELEPQRQDLTEVIKGRENIRAAFADAIEATFLTYNVPTDWDRAQDAREWANSKAIDALPDNITMTREFITQMAGMLHANLDPEARGTPVDPLIPDLAQLMEEHRPQIGGVDQQGISDLLRTIRNLGEAAQRQRNQARIGQLVNIAHSSWSETQSMLDPKPAFPSDGLSAALGTFLIGNAIHERRAGNIMVQFGEGVANGTIMIAPGLPIASQLVRALERLFAQPVTAVEPSPAAETAEEKARKKAAATQSLFDAINDEKASDEVSIGKVNDAIAAGADINAYNPIDKGGHDRNALHLAIFRKPAVALRLLDETELNIEAPTLAGGYKALHCAALQGELTIASKLITEGARHELSPIDPHGYVTPKTPLMEAAENGHLDICKLLLKKFPDSIYETTGTYDYTALHYATDKAHMNIVQLFLENEPAPESITQALETARFYRFIHTREGQAQPDKAATYGTIITMIKGAMATRNIPIPAPPEEFGADPIVTRPPTPDDADKKDKPSAKSGPRWDQENATKLAIGGGVVTAIGAMLGLTARGKKPEEGKDGDSQEKNNSGVWGWVIAAAGLGLAAWGLYNKMSGKNAAVSK